MMSLRVLIYQVEVLILEECNLLKNKGLLFRSAHRNDSRIVNLGVFVQRLFRSNIFFPFFIIGK